MRCMLPYIAYMDPMGYSSNPVYVPHVLVVYSSIAPIPSQKTSQKTSTRNPLLVVKSTDPPKSSRIPYLLVSIISIPRTFLQENVHDII